MTVSLEIAKAGGRTDWVPNQSGGSESRRLTGCFIEPHLQGLEAW